MQSEIKGKPYRAPSLTDVAGILVGHFTSPGRPTGCTVVTSAVPFTAGVDVGGGAPGTRETDLLKAENTVDTVNAIFLSGGSAFGLDAAGGISRYLEEQGMGLPVGAIRVPIVCGAVLYDLGLGDPAVRPDAAAGYEAAKAASADPVAEGNVGAGAGCTVGKLLGSEGAVKTGLGSWALTRSDGLEVGAVVAVNAVGDVVDPERGRIVAGARKPDGSGFADIIALMREGRVPLSPMESNTVIGVVATNALLTKAQCNKVARMSQDGLARCIYPAHMPWDGDTVFAVATGKLPLGTGGAGIGVVGALAADVLARAVLRAVETAETWGPYPAVGDLAFDR